MELKFVWDYSINDMGLSDFVDLTMGKIDEVVNEEYHEEYEKYPKV